jgi:two-component system LytT family sensor kinase
MNKKITLLRHLFFWLIFICYEITFLVITSGVSTTLIHLVIYYLLNIGLFYINAHVILDYAFFKTGKPYLVSFILICAELIAYLATKFGLDMLLSNGHLAFILEITSLKTYLYENMYRGVYFIGLSIAYWSMDYMIRFKERNHQMETEQLKTLAKNLELENKYMSVENAYLQNQISPHLLFNTLNFIFISVKKYSDDAAKGVTRLADLMRYSLVSADDHRTVLLTAEVGQLENLVKLCKMRFGNRFFLKFSKSGNLSGKRIIPLVLITLVENMMKHGDLGDRQHPARILLLVEEEQLRFETYNFKLKTNLYTNTGMGLKNVEKRLHSYYPDDYQFTVHDLEDCFTVNLTITKL